MLQRSGVPDSASRGAYILYQSWIDGWDRRWLRQKTLREMFCSPLFLFRVAMTSHIPGIQTISPVVRLKLRFCGSWAFGQFEFCNSRLLREFWVEISSKHLKFSDAANHLEVSQNKRKSSFSERATPLAKPKFLTKTLVLLVDGSYFNIRPLSRPSMISR